MIRVRIKGYVTGRTRVLFRTFKLNTPPGIRTIPIQTSIRTRVKGLGYRDD
jgi:hypothetical protein